MEQSNIQLFNYENKEVRTFEKDGQIWFVAADVAEITGHKRMKDTVNKMLDIDEAPISSLADKSGRLNHVQIINESGLYKLLFRSKLPRAKAFTKYVTSVILPTIRKTGSFNANTKQLQEVAHDKQELQVLTDTKNRINKRLRFLKMRIEENETAIYSAFSPNKSVSQPESEAFQYSLF